MNDNTIYKNCLLKNEKIRRKSVITLLLEQNMVFFDKRNISQSAEIADCNHAER